MAVAEQSEMEEEIADDGGRLTLLCREADPIERYAKHHAVPAIKRCPHDANAHPNGRAITAGWPQSDVSSSPKFGFGAVH
jgi:hypothetical protein